MAEVIGIQVEGLKELRRDLKKIDKALPKRLTRANKAFANQLVPSVRAEYQRQHTGHGKRPGRGAKSIRATATQSRARILIGRESVPYMGGQEFGSDHYPQFRPWSGKGPGGKGSKGKFLYPTVRAELPGLVDTYQDILDAEMRGAFPKGVAF